MMVHKKSGLVCIVLIGISILFGYQNCGNIALMSPKIEEASKLECVDHGKNLLILPSSSTDVSPATAFRIYERTSNGDVIEFEPQDPVTNWSWLKNGSAVEDNELFTLQNGRTELQTLIDPVNCTSGGTNISTRINICGEQVSVITNSFVSPDCEEPTTTTITIPPPGPVTPPPTVSIPGWTGGAAERCDADESFSNQPEPPVPSQCVNLVPGLSQRRIDFSQVSVQVDTPTVFRNLSQTYLHTGYCRNSDGDSYRSITNNEFYSLRFTAGENEQSSASFVGNILTMITISECPGDFGQFHENWPIANPSSGQSSSGRVRGLYYHADSIHKDRNQKGFRQWAWPFKTDYCLWSGSDATFPIMRFGTGTGVDATTCNLIPGKTYYMNIVARRADNNQPTASLPGRNFKLEVSRNCGGSTCPSF